MAACCIQYLWLLFVLGFTLFSGALKCHNGTMVKFGSGFTKETVDWFPQGFTQAGPKEICQETFLIVDVGAKSVLVWSKGSGLPRQWSSDRIEEIAKGPGIQAAMYINFCEFDDCNNATSSDATLGHFHFEHSYDTKSFQCPVCLTNQRSCPHNLIFCPKGTGCYSGTLKINGGGINESLLIEGCLQLTFKSIFRGVFEMGIFVLGEKVKKLLTANSFSLLFVPGTSLAWVVGLGLFLVLCLEGFILSAELISP